MGLLHTKNHESCLHTCVIYFLSHLTVIINSYFDTPYTLPKLDMIAIPDFAAGAMENYGLVTYRETALLYDDQNSAAANKQRVVFFFIKLL